MIVDRLRELRPPPGLTTRAEADRNLFLLRNGVRVPELTLTPQFTDIVAALSSNELDRLVVEGRASVGLVKPWAQLSKGLSSYDSVAASTILAEVGFDRLAFHMPWRFTRQDATEFYAPLKDKYLDMPQKYRAYGTRVWSSVINHAASGPVTVMLLTGDNAIEWWREKMGKTRSAQADPQSIRGKYAFQEMLPNNLVHGSDSAQSASRELKVIRASLLAVHAQLS